MMLISLGNGIPLRAGLDVGLGLRGMFPNEVYGPVSVSSYRLESEIA